MPSSQTRPSIKQNDDADPETPAEPESETKPGTLQLKKKLTLRETVNARLICEGATIGALCTALLLSNLTMLLAVLETPTDNRTSFYSPLVMLLAFSIGLQGLIGFLVVCDHYPWTKDPVEERDGDAEGLNRWLRFFRAVCIYLITLVNAMVMGIGIKYSDTTIPDDSRHLEWPLSLGSILRNSNESR